MKAIVRTATLALLLASVGCYNNLTIDRKVTPGTDFSKYRTWSFARQGEYVKTGYATLDDPGFRKSVGENTIKMMNKRGYTHVDSIPDLLFMYHVAVEPNPDQAKSNEAYEDYDMQWDEAGGKENWQQGSIMVFLIDAKTSQQVWTSTATAVLDPSAYADTRLARFNEVVGRMLAELPSPKK